VTTSSGAFAIRTQWPPRDLPLLTVHFLKFLASPGGTSRIQANDPRVE
jgi:hypothetical protein